MVAQLNLTSELENQQVIMKIYFFYQRCIRANKSFLPMQCIWSTHNRPFSITSSNLIREFYHKFTPIYENKK